MLCGVRSLERAGPTDLAHCAGARWLEALATTAAGAVLVAPEFAEAPGPATRIVVDDPTEAIVRVATAFHDRDDFDAGIDPTARIGAGATIGAGTRIEAYVVIGDDVTIGAGSRVGAHCVIEAGARLGNAVWLDAHVVVHHDVRLGDRVRCKSGAVIGGDGFGFLSSTKGHARIPQVGGCILEDDVDVGAGSCIDRGSLDDTVIGAGTKIDNLVHIAHNARLGRNCLVMAGVGVSGSTKVGDRVVLAGQAGLVGHIEIGDDARIGAQAGVIASVPPRGTVSGYPARPHREFLRAQAALYRLAPHIEALEALLNREPDA